MPEKERKMTDFTPLDMTVASTGGSANRSVGFDVRSAAWPAIKENLQSVDTDKTVIFREEKSPRDDALGDEWIWVWVTMNDRTSIRILLELAELGRGPAPEIKLRPNEYP